MHKFSFKMEGKVCKSFLFIDCRVKAKIDEFEKFWLKRPFFGGCSW